MNQQKDILEEMAKHLGVTAADLELGASLSDDLGLDPIGLSDLLADLSTKFNVAFDPTEIEGLRNVHDIVVMIEDLSLE